MERLAGEMERLGSGQTLNSDSADSTLSATARSVGIIAGIQGAIREASEEEMVEE